MPMLIAPIAKLPVLSVACGQINTPVVTQSDTEPN
jgi:hypothetical protein